VPYKAFAAIGRVSSPIGVIDLAGGSRHLLVKPIAALGTDLIGMGLATGLFIIAKPTWIKILAGVGGAWMGTAFVVEVVKLLSVSDATGI
jgi:hypothetical protein